MPNWVSNDLICSGKNEELRAFNEFAKQTKNEIYGRERYAKGEIEPLCAERFVPYPEEARQQAKELAAIESMEGNALLNPQEKGKSLTKAQKSKLKKLKVLFALKFDKKGFSFYDWNCKYLGTKWGLCYSELRQEEYRKNGKGKLIYTFDTAWSPCLPVIVAMSKKFPKLHFTNKYYEAGMGFKGTFICKAGKILKNEQKRYSPHWGNARGG